MGDLTPHDIAKKALRFTEIAADSERLYWLEGRSSEKGRQVLMSETGEVLSSEVNVKSRIHEYGGASFIISPLVYINDTDKCVYYNQKPLTTPDRGRLADFAFDQKRNCLYAVSEKGKNNSLVQINLDGSLKTLSKTHDFYASPRLSADGQRLVWIAWDHPFMPWDQTMLYSWDFKNSPACIQKGAAIQEPFFINNTLYFISDKNGFWNLYNEEGCVNPKKADLGYPPWVLGIHRTALYHEKIACVYTENASDFITIFDPQNKREEKLNLPFTSITSIAATSKDIYAIAASPTLPASIVSIDPKNSQFDIIASSRSMSLPKEKISMPHALTFQNRKNQPVHLFFYPPTKKAFKTPPLILRCHGGPTAHSAPSFNLEIQYFTSLGFAYAEVNYGGSSGYGKAYRERLKNNWGITDVHDVCDAALFLAQENLVDQEKMAITGSSAGGYTALAAITFGDVFTAAVSLYGISDLESLTAITHKFESHYNDYLLGTDDDDRSPINHLDKIHCPILLLQGSEDKIVPPEQSEKLYRALKQKNIPCTYHVFEGEGHGFRRSDTIQKALELETDFYSQIFKI